MNYIILLLFFPCCFAMAPDKNLFVVDPQQKVIKLTAAKKKALKQCVTIKYQQEETASSTISFSSLNHDFVRKNIVRNLIKSIRNPVNILKFNDKTLFPVLLAADYLNAPESIRTTLAAKTLARLNGKKLSDQEKEIKKCALQNRCIHLSGLIEKYCPELLAVDQYNTIASYGWNQPHLYIENSQKHQILSRNRFILEKNEKIYLIRSLGAFPLFKKIKKLVLAHQAIEDFCLTELIAGMPKLCHLDLHDNNIRQLTAAQLDGMPTTFRLCLCDNPIPLSKIDADYFTHDRFRNHRKSLISLNPLGANQVEIDKIFKKNKTFCSDTFYKKIKCYSPPTLGALLAGTAFFYVWFFCDHTDIKEDNKRAFHKFFGTYITLVISFFTWIGIRGFIKLPPHRPHLTISIPRRSKYYFPNCSSKYEKD